MVKILNGGGLDTLLRVRDEFRHGDTHLGRLAGPRNIADLGDVLDAGIDVGVDNDVYCNWNRNRYIRQIGEIEKAALNRPVSRLERLSPLIKAIAPELHREAFGAIADAEPPSWHPNLLFVTVPDVVADAEATARRWSEWAPLMSHLPLALCVQDGAEDIGIPWAWPNLRCLFMAGSTGFKLSSAMADICREGKRRGLHIHCGRVNTRKRIRYLLGLEFVDTIDGTAFNKWRNTHLPWALDLVAAQEYQLVLAPEPSPHL